MSTIETEAETLAEQYGDQLSGVTAEGIEDKLVRLCADYQVPVEEAARTVENDLQDQAGSQAPSNPGEFDPIPVSEADTDGEFVDLVVKFIENWDPRSDDMEQVGLFAGESGTIKYSNWVNTNEVPRLEVGQSYKVSNVVVKEYEGRYSVKVVDGTSIEEAGSEVETSSGGVTVEGLLVEVKAGSGLVKRCPEDDCTRVLRKGACADHGKQDEHELDLRIKAILDNGANTYDLVFTTEPTEELGGITVDEAETIFRDNLDSAPVDNHIEAAALGSYFRIEGGDTGDNIIVNDYEVISGPSEESISDLEARIVADEVADE